jgi:hypothetical protein
MLAQHFLHAHQGSCTLKLDVPRHATRTALPHHITQVLCSASTVQQWAGVQAVADGMAKTTTELLGGSHAAAASPRNFGSPKPHPDQYRCATRVCGEPRTVTATHVGTYALKGVKETMALFCCDVLPGHTGNT